MFTDPKEYGRDTWTAYAVRCELPDVPVRVGKNILVGAVRGRLCPFAAVSVTMPDNLITTKEVAWETIAYCLNAGKPVTFTL